MKRARSRSQARPSPFMVFASACCAVTATASPRYGSRRWRGRQPASDELNPALAGRGGMDRKGVHAAGELTGKCRINHAVTLDPALSPERLGHDINAEMGLSAWPVTGMAG